MTLYPIFLKLAKKDCLVIGGGNVAERKVQSLLESDANVTVIAPVVTERLDALGVERKICIKKREYESGDLKGYFLVVASTDLREVNKKIYDEASELNILINCVDEPESCNFYVPSQVKRGDVQIAISSSGAIPYFTKMLRKYLEEKIPEEISVEIEKLAKLRKKIIGDSGENQDQKMRKFEQILEPEARKIIEKIDKQW